jgi:outer membrane protein assembly factor BamB
MNKRLAVLLSVCLIVIVIGSFIWYVATPKYATPDGGSIVWQKDMAHFKSGFAVADGKVFLTDNGNLYCFSASSGKSIWNATFTYGSYSGTQVTVYEGKVYASMGSLTVGRFNEDTGQMEMQYKAPPTHTNDYKFTPSFFLADGKVFITYPGTAVYDAATGQLLWSDSRDLVANNVTSSLPESDFAYIVHSDSTSRIDPNSGKVIWTFPGYGGSMLLSQEQVVLWNFATKFSYPQTEHIIVCLDINTGQELWRFDPKTPVFQPTVYDGLLLFGAQDGNFYALNMTNGSLSWKAYIDDSGLIQNYNNYQSLPQQPSYVSLTASKPLIDSQNQRILWSIFSGNVYNTINEPSINSGVVMSLNLQNGDKEWYTPFNNSLIYQVYGQSMALLNNELFVTGSDAVYCLKASTGSVLWERSFDHYVFNPILADNKVFVVADAYIIAYR